MKKQSKILSHDSTPSDISSSISEGDVKIAKTSKYTTNTDLTISYKCRNCEAIIRVKKNQRKEDLKPCCKKPDLFDFNEEFSLITATEAEENFKSPELIFKIHKEISQKHLFDDKIKMATLLVCCTAYLRPADRHKSIALKGSRSVGKDNLFKSVLGIFPEEDYLILTNATQAALEDDIARYKIIAHSEVNLQKDDKGAGAHLVEAIKQLTEGGMDSLKKDVATGYKTIRHSKQEQKSVIYGTAEVGTDDDELQTRFIVGAVEAPVLKIQGVNENTLKDFSGQIAFNNQSYWFAYGIKALLKNSQVVIPFLKYLPTDFFDNSDARSMRDTKRFLSTVAAVAWLYQLQRGVDNAGRIVAEPFDFLIALITTADFFNWSYQGMGDVRIQRFMDCINDYLTDRGTLDQTFNRFEIQQRMNVSINTVKKLLIGCHNLSIIRFHHKDGNDIYYERCQKGVKKVLMGVNWRDLISHFKGVKGVKIPQSTGYLLEKWEKVLENPYLASTLEKIDTLKLTPCSEVLIDNNQEGASLSDLCIVAPSASPPTLTVPPSKKDIPMTNIPICSKCHSSNLTTWPNGTVFCRDCHTKQPPKPLESNPMTDTPICSRCGLEAVNPIIIKELPYCKQCAYEVQR